MKRIGVTQRVEIVSNRRERRDGLDQAWTDVLHSCGMVAVPFPNKLPDPVAYAKALSLDGILLSGGNDLSHLEEVVNPALERDNLEAALIDYSASENVPLLGVCRGMQMLVCHTQGEIVTVEHHVQTLHLIEKSNEASLPIVEREVNSYHRFGVPLERLSGDWIPAAFSPDGLVEAIEHKTAKQWGIMWHPERDPRSPEDLDLLRWVFGGAQ